ncbi:hypothetical protein ACPFL9_19545 [Paenarthrobacter sp. NyZ202]|uniref:hypothetical protein n=1 Tax=Paenarthrobacter sp. NyZ202 TaxID=3402689 RepID=UPI003CEE7349
MGQGLVGADVADLRRLSKLMDSEAEKITTLQRQLGSLIDNGHYWKGNDAERFRSLWRSDLHARLAAAALCLKTNARTLRLNADQQEQASVGSAGPGGAGGSGSGELPGFTIGPRTYGPVTVEGYGSVGVEGTGQVNGSVGPHGIDVEATGEVSAGGRAVFTATSENGPVSSSITNETFIGARADGGLDASVPFGFGLPEFQATGEAFVGVENITTAKSEFFDGWVNSTSTARFMTGAEAEAHAVGSGFLFSPGGEAFAGQKVTLTQETEFAGGLFTTGQGTELRGGAWASAGQGELSVDKSDKVTGGASSAGAGAELTQSQYVEVLGQRLATSATAAVGAGEGYNFTASLDEDGFTLGVGAKITAEIGLGAGAEITISPSGFMESVSGFADFITK